MRQILFSRKYLLVAVLAISALLPVALWGCGTAGSATPTVAAPTTAAMPAYPTVMSGMSGMSGAMGSDTPLAGTAGVEMTWETATLSYSLTLRLGPLQQMLTPDQAKGATSGEVMVSGEMAMAGTGGMAPNYHVELAVNDIKNGSVITDKSVTINLTNVTTRARQAVPIAMMYDVQQGPADTHFGNNVALEPGNYTVEVDVAGEKGTFSVTTLAMPPMPATPSAMSTPGPMVMSLTPTQ